MRAGVRRSAQARRRKRSGAARVSLDCFACVRDDDARWRAVSESATDASPPKPRLVHPREAPAALIMKIFLLPKLATQSPRNSVFRSRCVERSMRDEFARIEHRSKKALQCRYFLHSLQMPTSKILAALGSSCASLTRLRVEVRCARAPLLVNTSLSGTLFFSMCWCIRDVVHLDSRMHAAL